jgi:hypothetical protein
MEPSQDNLKKPLQKYFRGIADHLASQSEITASVGNHRGDRGENREEALLDVLSKHLPGRLKAELGGQIIGLSGQISKQIDIIISNDLAIRFEHLKRNFVLVEGVAAVVSVKSYLDKDALFDCLDNFASIPRFDSRVVKFPLLEFPLLKFTHFVSSYPRCFIFAYDGLKVKTLGEHIEEYIKESKQISQNRFPKLTVVNRQGMINFMAEEGKTLDGREFPSKTLLFDDLTPETYGQPFTYILHELSKYLTWLPHMELDFSQYFSENFNPNMNDKNG